jgi:[protein-PII] uridylyltransferase
MYHVYTVDEHSIRAIGILSRIERGELEEDHPLSTSIFPKINSRRVLYLAVLLHDIAKGRGGDHSVLGAEIAEKLGPRLGLDAAETETVSWLVRHHLLMSHTAFCRDINETKTINDFIEVVQSPERLRLLLVLTVVDIRAVGPTVWNGWKAVLLRELYSSAEEAMSGDFSLVRREDRIAAAKEALRRALPKWSKADFAGFESLGTPVYWLSQDIASHIRQAKMVHANADTDHPLAIDCRVDKPRDVTEVTIYTSDHPGLSSSIAGAIALAGGNIVDARIFTLTNGMAMDAFSVQEVGDWVQESGGHVFEDADKIKELERLIEATLTGALRPGEELARRSHALPERSHVFTVPPQVHMDNSISATNTVIEINGRDRPGLLFEVTQALTDCGLQISTAKVATYGERVVDVFYVKDIFGLKMENDSKMEQVREALLRVLEPSEGASKPTSRGKAEAPEKVQRRRQRRSQAKARSVRKTAAG